MDRQTFAYLLIAGLAGMIVAIILYTRHHGHERTNMRNRRRDTARYDRVMMEKDAEALRNDG